MILLRDINLQGEILKNFFSLGNKKYQLKIKNQITSGSFT